MPFLLFETIHYFHRNVPRVSSKVAFLRAPLDEGHFFSQLFSPVSFPPFLPNVVQLSSVKLENTFLLSPTK